MSIAGEAPVGFAAKRKAPDDGALRNVRPKPSADSISLNLSEEQAYKLLAHLTPDDDLFRSLARDLITRTAPERRFQEAMLEDIMERLQDSGMSEANAQAARSLLNENLKSYLSQKFSDGIGRSQPSLKHLRNLFYTVLEAFDKTHPGQTPKDLAKNMYKLFTVQSDNQPRSESPRDSRMPEQSSNHDTSASARPSIITNGQTSSLAASYAFEKAEQNKGATSTIEDRSQSQMEPVVTTNGVDQQSMPSRAASFGGVKNGLPAAVNNTHAPETQVRSGNVDATIITQVGTGNRELVQPQTSHAAVQREASTMSSGIDDLIREVVGRQQSSMHERANNTSANTSIANGTAPDLPKNEASALAISRPSDEGRKTQSQSNASQQHSGPATAAARTNGLGKASGAPKSQFSPVLPDVQLLDGVPSQVPTVQIPTSRLTCWYWYYRAPPCIDRLSCRYQHKIMSHVAARDWRKPPIVIQSSGGQSSPTRPVQKEAIPQSPPRSIKGLAADTAIKREEGEISDSESSTPILDLFWDPRDPVTYQNRDTVLEAVMTNILSRGDSNGFITQVKDQHGKAANLSLDGTAGLRSKFIGLSNTFAKVPRALRSNLENLLRSFVLANKERFPEYKGNGTPDRQARRESDLYNPSDIGIALRGTASSHVDYRASTGYDSPHPGQRPVHNEKGMTCPYWLRGGCSKGRNCLFQHQVTPWLAASAGRGRPQALRPDGSLAY